MDYLRELAKENADWGKPLHPELEYTGVEVIWAVREEMARTIDDVLARRTRALLLNARAAMEMAPAVARLMASELNRGIEWEKEQLVSFNKIAEGYLLRK